MRMRYTEQLKKYGADKIFLLALFAFSLLIAYLIVMAKKTIVLGEPVEIPQAGLSIRLPSGNGWQSDKSWRQNEDELLLNSYLIPNPGLILAGVECRYRLASSKESPRQWLEQYATQYDATNPEYGTQQIDDARMEWVYIKSADDTSGALAATVQLGLGRRLDIEITQSSAEEEITLDIFEKITKQIVIKENKLLEKGIDAVNSLKAVGLDKVIPQNEEPCYYLVKDSGKHEVGFVVEMFLKSDNTDGTEIQAAGFGYIRSPIRWEKAMLFKSDAGLDDFVWESEIDQEKTVERRMGRLTIRSPKQNFRASTTITAVEGNEILINRSGFDYSETGQPEPKESSVETGKAAIPGAVLEPFYIRMVDSNTDKVMVDIISSEGQVEPAIISIAKQPQNKPKAAYNVLIRYIGSNETEVIDLDNEMNIIGKTIKRDGILFLEPASLESLLRRFPERADDILQRTRAIKQGRL